MKLIIYLIVFFNFLYTQGFDDDIKLTDVKVKGNMITSKNTIIFTSGLHKGQNVKTSEFPRAVKKLWKLGLFKNIQILYEEETKQLARAFKYKILEDGILSLKYVRKLKADSTTIIDVLYESQWEQISK